MTSPENTQAILEADKAKHLTEAVLTAWVGRMHLHRMWFRVPFQTQMALMEQVREDVSRLINNAFKPQ